MPPAPQRGLNGALGERFSQSELRYLWGLVGYEAAREHHERALEWYARADTAQLEDRHLAWKVRAALRAGQWKVVRESIDRMSPASANHPAWIYWYGRALAAQKEDMASRAFFLRIAGQSDFYGLLANEELGYLVALPQETYTPSEAEVVAAGAEPGLARALELHPPRHPRRGRARMAVRHPLLRRPEADRRGRARAPRRGLRPRDPYRRPHLAHP